MDDLKQTFVTAFPSEMHYPYPSQYGASRGRDRRVLAARDVGAFLKSKGGDPEADARMLLAKRQLALVSTSDKTIDLTSASQLVQLPRFARAGVVPKGC
jgi:hypothetical protein